MPGHANTFWNLFRYGRKHYDPDSFQLTIVNAGTHKHFLKNHVQYGKKQDYPDFEILSCIVLLREGPMRLIKKII